MEVTVLELVDLGKRYGEREVLADVSLAVSPGESLALLGANGSGKTTVLRCAMGLHHPDRGRVMVDGIDMSRRPAEARAHLSYLPQRVEFPSTLTVKEILTFTARLRGLKDDAVERELALCGLAPFATRTVARLSGGERQRVALAVLFLPEVSAYLLDEPTTNLDAGATALLVERVSALRAEGRAVLFTTHVDSDVARLATRTALLHEGRIVATEPVGAEEEERHADVEPLRAVGASAAFGGVRGRSPRPGGGAAGSRDLCEVRHVDFERRKRR